MGHPFARAIDQRARAVIVSGDVGPRRLDSGDHFIAVGGSRIDRARARSVAVAKLLIEK
jgi:hypothetical protein